MPRVPAIGVVVTNHNNGAYVERAIGSIARQTLRDLHVVVVDDASTDQSDMTIRQCLADLDDPRFRYVRLESNVGQTGAVRRGLAELDTPFVCFLDSDDIWYDDFVARQIAAHLNADFPVALTYCDSHIIDADDRMLAGTAWWFDSAPGEWQTPVQRTIDSSLMPTMDPATGELTYGRSGRLTFHSHWSQHGATNSMASMMFRRKFVDLVLVQPNHELKLYLDFYLSTLACLLTGAIALHDCLYAYRMHGRNKHSNAEVLGGAYNSSTQSWEPVRKYVLGLVQGTLQSEAATMRKAFGADRHALAETMLRDALADQQGDRANRPWNRLWEAARAMVADLGSGRSPQWVEPEKADLRRSLTSTR